MKDKKFDKEKYIKLETRRTCENFRRNRLKFKPKNLEEIKFYGDTIENDWEVLNDITGSHQQKQNTYPKCTEGLTTTTRKCISEMHHCSSYICTPFKDNEIAGNEIGNKSSTEKLLRKQRKHLVKLGWAEFIQNPEDYSIQHWTPTKKGLEIIFKACELSFSPSIGESPADYFTGIPYYFLKNPIISDVPTDLLPPYNEGFLMELNKIKVFSNVFAPSEGGKYFIETLKKESKSHPKIYENDWDTLISLYNLGLEDTSTLQKRYRNQSELNGHLYLPPLNNKDPTKLLSLLERKVQEK